MLRKRHIQKINQGFQNVWKRHGRFIRRMRGETEEYERSWSVFVMLGGLVILLGLAFTVWKSKDDGILVGLGLASVAEPDTTEQVAALDTLRLAAARAERLRRQAQRRDSALAAAGAGRRPDSARQAEPEEEGRKLGAGQASYYGPGLQGNPTASGERFDQNRMTAAHRSLPMGSRVRVTNMRNGKSVVVRINDRGPFAKHRVIDLSKAAAGKIGMLQSGTAQVRLELITSNARDSDGQNPPLGVSLMWW